VDGGWAVTGALTIYWGGWSVLAYGIGRGIKDGCF